MKTILHLSVNRVDNQALTDELIGQFPEGTHRAYSGVITCFQINELIDNPLVVRVLTYLEERGYEVTSEHKKDPKHVFGRREYIHEPIDIERSPLLKFTSKVELHNGYAILKDDRIIATSPPDEFRVCASYDGFTFVTPLIRAKLETSGLRELKFLPIDVMLKNGDMAPGHQVEEFARVNGVRELADITCLYTSIILPTPSGRKDGLWVYSKKAVAEAGNFDLAVVPKSDSKRYAQLICSKDFYNFWKKNFRDADWNPLALG